MTLSAALASLDLERFAAENLAGAQRHGDEIRATCPGCAKDEKLWINVRKRAWLCYYCSGVGARARGGVLALVQWVLGVGEVDACRYVLLWAEPDHRRIDVLEAALDAGGVCGAVVLRDLPEMPLPEGCVPAVPGHPYVVARGIPAEAVSRERIGVCLSGRYYARLVLPCVMAGRVVYWQARAMWTLRPGDRKVLNPENESCACLDPRGLPRADCRVCSGTGDVCATANEVLFGFDSAVRQARVALVEGPISALRVGSDAVATLGKKISVVQALRLAAAGVREVDLMWDSDAMSEVLTAAPWLSAFFTVRVVVLPWGDPGDRTQAESAALRVAAPIFDPSAALMRV